jgi:hypothetical protein
MDLQPGTAIGPYRVSREIGRGAAAPASRRLTPVRQWDMLGTDRFLLVLNEDEEENQARFEDVHPDRLVYIQNRASRLKTGE